MVMIEKEAFFRCENLTALKLPASLTYLGERAFGGCSGLDPSQVSLQTTILVNPLPHTLIFLTTLVPPFELKPTRSSKKVDKRVKKKEAGFSGALLGH